MATYVDEQPTFKHFCRICKKGFMCGRALGGHMRAHGIGDESGHIDDEDPVSDWEAGGKSPPSNKRMYALRTNPNRLKSCKNCENCGKEFASWKSFLEHGKCSSADVGSLNVTPPGSDDEDGMQRGYGWSKGKRTRRVHIDNVNTNCSFSEEEDLANCLVMLSNARVDPWVVETEESCASASKEERRNSLCMMPPLANRVSNNKAKGVARGMFECKACKKVFNSHQALGGHRASHKKVKGCFAARQDDLDESIMDDDVITNDDYSFMSKSAAPVPSESSPQLTLGFSYKRKSKVHECTICHRIFSSGQALGGHKRCHWLTSSSTDTSAVVKFPNFQDQNQHLHQKLTLNKFEPDALDLNLPAPGDEKQDPKKLLSLEVPADIYLQPWIGVQAKTDTDKQRHPPHDNQDNPIDASMPTVDDEADSKVKLAKLSDLKDVNMSGGSSPWLQVGIGSSSNVGGGDP
ncbi:hypothetical protein AQUCO_01300745v1 [Aquilegia coerulea]|uniref:C2H2-type domain-containing protein n=1 Tax=Aquilegia coerulea TaxID=218851 RepID=A0A2G5E383_AQUCA|nr:hypothetical protein AQUCO_01300745v1 [Aquilegia coerulea]